MDFDFEDDDFNFEEKPKKETKKPAAKKQDDEFDFGDDDFNIDEEKPKPAQKAKKINDEFDFGDDDFGEPEPPKKAEPKKQQKSDDFGFEDDFEVEKPKIVPKPVSKPTQPKKGDDENEDFNFDEIEKQKPKVAKKQDDFGDFGDDDFNFETKPDQKAKTKQNDKVDQIDKIESEFDDFAFDEKPVEKDPPKAPSNNRTNSNNRAGSAPKKGFFNAPAKPVETQPQIVQPVQLIQQNKQVTIQEAPIAQKEKVHTVFQQQQKLEENYLLNKQIVDQPIGQQMKQDVVLQNNVVGVQNNDQVIQLLHQIIAQQNAQQQQQNSEIQQINSKLVELKNAQQSINTEVVGVKQQSQQISQIINDQLIDQQQKQENDVNNQIQSFQQQIQKFTSQIQENLTQMQNKSSVQSQTQEQLFGQVNNNLQQLQQLQNQLQVKQSQIQLQENSFVKQQQELTIQRNNFINEQDGIEQQKQQLNNQQLICNQLIKQSNQLIEQLQNIDQTVKQKIDQLFEEKSINSQSMQLISKVVNQQLDAVFKNYVGNVNSMLDNNQLQIIQLLQQLSQNPIKSGDSQGNVMQTAQIQQQQQLQISSIKQLFSELNNQMLINSQEINQQISSIPTQINEQLGSQLAAIVKSFGNVQIPSDNQDYQENNQNKLPGGTTCAVYLELVKQLQNKVEASETMLRSQNQNILEQQMQIKMQLDENDKIKQSYLVKDKQSQLMLQKAQQLEEINNETLQRLHQKERELMIKEQQMKLQHEEVFQNQQQMELKETQLEKLRIEINQRRDELKNQQLIYEVEAEKQEIRQMQEVESRVYNNYRSGSVSRYNTQNQQYQPVEPIQYLPNQQNQLFYPYSQQQQMSPQQYQQQQQIPIQSNIQQRDLQSFQKAKEQLRDVVQRGSSVGVANTQMQPNGNDIDQKLEALKISYGLQLKENTQMKQQMNQKGASQNQNDPNSTVQQQQQLINQMMQQMQQMSQAQKQPTPDPNQQMMQQMMQQMQQMQVQQQKAKHEATPSDNINQVLNKQFTPLPNNMVQTNVQQQLPQVSPPQYEIAKDSLVVSGPPKKPVKQQVIQEESGGRSSMNIASLSENHIKQDIAAVEQQKAKPVECQVLTQQKPFAQQQQQYQQNIPAKPVEQPKASVKNPFDASDSSSLAGPQQPMTIASKSDATHSIIKAPNFSLESSNSQNNISSNMKQQSNIQDLAQKQPSLKLINDEESGLSGFDFKFDFKPDGKVDTSSQNVQQSSPGIQSSKVVSNPFEDAQKSVSNAAGAKNAFGEFKYDNNNFNIFGSDKSSTSPFFPF